MGVFGHEEQGEFHGTVFEMETSHDLGLAFRQVKGVPVGFSEYRDNKEDETQQNYLRLMLQELAQHSGVSTTVDEDSRSGQRFARYLNSEDRFKLSLVWSEDLIELERIRSFRSGKADYLGSADKSTRGDRRILHIFPAEVNAAHYEDRLPELKQKVRLFSDDVTLQLEDPKDVRLFLLLYAYDLVGRAFERDETGTDQPYWRLLLPTEHEFDEYGNKAEPTEIRLTKPGDSSLLNGLKTFDYEGRDVRHQEGYDQPIDYERVKRALANERSEAADHRVRENSAGEYSPDIRDNFAILKSDPVTLQEVKIEAARLDGVRKLQKRIENKMLPVYKDALPTSQDDYDMASVFALILRDEVNSVRDRLKNRIDAAVRAGNIVVTDKKAPSISTKKGYDDMW